MTIRRLEIADAAAYRRLMLEGYAAHPEAFTSTATERAELPLEWWQARLSPEPVAAQLVIGAFVGAELAGVAGLAVEQRQKTRHKATLFGMYIDPAHRRRGVGRQLVLAILKQAANYPGLRIVQLTVTEGNDIALALYQQCGFAKFAIEPQAIAVNGQYYAKVHMWYDLRQQ